MQPFPEFKVYALVDPRTHEVRYVGQTGNRLEERLVWHYYSPHNPELAEWLAELQRLNLEPVMLHLASAWSRSDVKAVEARLITTYSSIRLLNVSGNPRTPRKMRRHWTLDLQVPFETAKRIAYEAEERGIDLDLYVSMLLCGFQPAPHPPLSFPLIGPAIPLPYLS